MLPKTSEFGGQVDGQQHALRKEPRNWSRLAGRTA